MHIIAAKAVCFGEALTPAFREYQHNIRVNCVTLIGLEPLEGESSQFQNQHAERTLLKRCCGHEDLKGGIVYLASQASSFVTGTNLVIDGGYSAK